MKITNDFQPVNISIEIENQEEFDQLVGFFRYNASIPDYYEEVSGNPSKPIQQFFNKMGSALTGPR